MNFGLIIIYTLAFISLLLSAHMHGKPRSNYNFWATLTDVVLWLILIWWTLGWRFI